MDLNTHYLGRRYTNNQQPHEKMLDSIIHLENANAIKTIQCYLVPKKTFEKVILE